MDPASEVWFDQRDFLSCSRAGLLAKALGLRAARKRDRKNLLRPPVSPAHLSSSVSATWMVPSLAWAEHGVQIVPTDHIYVPGSTIHH